MSIPFWKRIVDVLMIVVVIALMGCSFTGDVVHECLGIVFFVLIGIHHALNCHWYRTLVNRNRSRYQLVLMFTMTVLFMVLLTMMISSVLVSRTLFAFIDHDGGLFARQFHQMATHWGLILAAIHFGIYSKRLFSVFRPLVFRPSDFRPSVIRTTTAFQSVLWKAGRFVVVVLITAICVYGIVASFRHDIGGKLLMRQAYSFWGGSGIVFFADYTAVFVLYATTAHVTVRQLFYKKTSRFIDTADLLTTEGKS